MNSDGSGPRLGPGLEPGLDSSIGIGQSPSPALTHPGNWGSGPGPGSSSWPIISNEDFGLLTPFGVISYLLFIGGLHIFQILPDNNVYLGTFSTCYVMSWFYKKFNYLKRSQNQGNMKNTHTVTAFVLTILEATFIFLGGLINTAISTAIILVLVLL